MRGATSARSARASCRIPRRRSAEMRGVGFSHGHPTFNKGGGELAAWNLYRAIQQSAGNEAWFIARTDTANLHLGTHVAAVNEREFLVSGQADCAELSATMPLGDNSDF